MLGHVGPNWFTSVMGTGIVVVALLASPIAIPGARPVAAGFWLLSAGLLVLVTVATVLHHLQHPDAAREHREHPVMVHFYGAPAMGLMTVGAGALLVGAPGGLGIDAVLWTAGTALGLVTAIVVPLRVWGRADAVPAAWWLMPVVPPFVSATTGALLAPHVPDGALRTLFLAGCWTCFLISVAFVLRVLPLVGARLRTADLAVGAVPTLWIALGPLGQSATAVDHLHAPRWLALSSDAVLCGLAVVALVVLLVLTLRTRPPFALTWWAFTFPVGTVTTGTAALAGLTGSSPIEVASVVLLAGLVVAWSLVFTLTVRGVLTGRLLRS